MVLLWKVEVMWGWCRVLARLINWDATQLARLELLQVLVANAKENLPRNFNALIDWIVDEVTSVTSHTPLYSMVHSTGHSAVILGPRARSRHMVYAEASWSSLLLLHSVMLLCLMMKTHRRENISKGCSR